MLSMKEFWPPWVTKTLGFNPYRLQLVLCPRTPQPTQGQLSREAKDVHLRQDVAADGISRHLVITQFGSSATLENGSRELDSCNACTHGFSLTTSKTAHSQQGSAAEPNANSLRPTLLTDSSASAAGCIKTSRILTGRGDQICTMSCR